MLSFPLEKLKIKLNDQYFGLCGNTIKLLKIDSQWNQFQFPYCRRTQYGTIYMKRAKFSSTSKYFYDPEFCSENIFRINSKNKM